MVPMCAQKRKEAFPELNDAPGFVQYYRPMEGESPSQFGNELMFSGIFEFSLSAQNRQFTAARTR